MKLLILVIALALAAPLSIAQKRKSALMKCDCSTIMTFTKDLRMYLNNSLNTILDNPNTQPEVKKSLDTISVALHVQKSETLLPTLVELLTTLVTTTSESNLGVTINIFDLLVEILPTVTATQTQGDSVLQVVTLLLRIIVNLFVTQLDTTIVNFSVVNGVVLSRGSPVAAPVIMNLLRDGHIPRLNSLSTALLGNVFDIGTPLLPSVNNVLGLLDGAAGGGLTSTTGGLLTALTGLVGNLQAMTGADDSFVMQPSQFISESAIAIDITSMQTITRSDTSSRSIVATYRINLTALPGILTRLVAALSSSTDETRVPNISSTVSKIQEVLQRFARDTQGSSEDGALLARSVLDLIDELGESDDPSLTGFVDELTAAMVVVDMSDSQSLITTPAPRLSSPIISRTTSIVLTLTKTQNNSSDVTQIKKEINIADLDKVLSTIVSLLDPRPNGPLAHRRIKTNIEKLRAFVEKIAAEDYNQNDVLTFVNLLITVFNSLEGLKDPRFDRALVEFKTMLPVFPKSEPTYFPVNEEAPLTTVAAITTTRAVLITAMPKVTSGPIEVVSNSSRTIVVGSNPCVAPMTAVVRKLGVHLVDDLRSLAELLENIDGDVSPRASRLIRQLVFLLDRVTSGRITDASLLNHVVDILAMTMRLKTNAGSNTSILSIVDLLQTKLRSILAIFTSSSDGIISSISLTTTVLQVLFNGGRLGEESAINLLRQMCFNGKFTSSWNIVNVVIQLLEKLVTRLDGINPNIVSLIQKLINQLKELAPTSSVNKTTATANLTSTLQELVGAISNSGLTSTQQNSLNGIVKLVLSILLRATRSNGNTKWQNLMTGIQVNSNADCTGVLAAVGCLVYDILSKNGGRFGKIVVHVGTNSSAV